MVVPFLHIIFLLFYLYEKGDRHWLIGLASFQKEHDKRAG